MRSGSLRINDRTDSINIESRVQGRHRHCRSGYRTVTWESHGAPSRGRSRLDTIQ